MIRALFAVTLAAAGAAHAGFSISDEMGVLKVDEDGAPVLVYHYEAVHNEDVEPRYWRASYIHPLYGLDGEVLTQDFPDDHYHHRGIFWAWPKSTVGNRTIDIWSLDGARQVHQKFIGQEAGEDQAVIAVRNAWVFADAPAVPVIQETVQMTIHPARKDTRAIDFELEFMNVSDKTVTIRGATAKNKGYGGFNYRPHDKRIPMHFTTADGPIPLGEDQLRYESPWVDVSFATKKKSDKQIGVAMFQHPSLPGFPHPGWILRHYGFLGQSWPHTEPYALAPGEAFTLRYRLLVHRGDAEAAEVKRHYEAYRKKAQAE